jgi:group I intron endonuclease
MYKKTEAIEGTEKVFGYIYKLTSPSGKMYIGQTRNPASRFNNYKNLESKNQTVLHAAILKYGFDGFKKDVICACHSLDDMNKAERYYIDY